MTWTKLGTEFSDQCADAGLSDVAYRTHVETLQHIYSVDRTDVADLTILKGQVRRVATSDQYEQAVKELVAAEFWADRGDCWEIVHHAAVVRASLIAQRKLRERNAKAQQAWRGRHKPEPTADVSDDVSAYVSDGADRQTDKQLRDGTHDNESKCKVCNCAVPAGASYCDDCWGQRDQYQSNVDPWAAT